MIDVATAVEFDGGLKSDHLSDVIFAFCFMIFFEGDVEVGYVAFVVFGVM